MPGDRDHDRDRFPMDELNGKYARKAPHNTSLQLHRPTLTVTQTNIGFAPRPNRALTLCYLVKGSAAAAA